MTDWRAKQCFQQECIIKSCGWSIHLHIKVWFITSGKSQGQWSGPSEHRSSGYTKFSKQACKISQHSYTQRQNKFSNSIKKPNIMKADDWCPPDIVATTPRRSRQNPYMMWMYSLMTRVIMKSSTLLCFHRVLPERVSMKWNKVVTLIFKQLWQQKTDQTSKTK